MKAEEGQKILSWNKTFQGYSKELLKAVPGDLDLGLLRLTQLKEYPWDKSQNYQIERGITDFLEFWTHSRCGRWDPEFIEPWIKAESDILPEISKKVLLVMEDPAFIQEKVLVDPWRAEHLGTLETYQSRQEDYVQFTEHWNKIDQKIIITDANDYLLKLKK
jgi:hypothetical protein